MHAYVCMCTSTNMHSTFMPQLLDWSVTNPVGAWLSRSSQLVWPSPWCQDSAVCALLNKSEHKGFLGDGLPGYTRLLSYPPQCPGPRLSMSALTFIFMQNLKLVCLCTRACVCVCGGGGGTDKWKMQ